MVDNGNFGCCGNCLDHYVSSFLISCIYKMQNIGCVVCDSEDMWCVCMCECAHLPMESLIFLTFFFLIIQLKFIQVHIYKCVGLYQDATVQLAK